MDQILTHIFHGVSLTLTISILTILLREHKVWTRVKDRLNTLWSNHCKETGDEYVALDNGKH